MNQILKENGCIWLEHSLLIFLKDTIEEENTYDMPFIKGHYEDEHTFIGTMRVDFNRYPFDGNEIPQHFIWSLKINSILYPNVETGVNGKIVNRR